MTKRFKGGLMSSTSPSVSLAQASGYWNHEDVATNMLAQNWPGIVVTQTFSYTGSLQILNIPTNLLGGTVTVTALGSAGGSDSSGSLGGTGANVTATVTVTAGTVLFIVVGNANNGVVGGAAASSVSYTHLTLPTILRV